VTQDLAYERTCLCTFKEGMNDAIQSNSGGSSILPVLEKLFCTKIGFWQIAPYIILYPKSVGSSSCHILAGVGVLSKLIAVIPSYAFHAPAKYHVKLCLLPTCKSISQIFNI